MSTEKKTITITLDLDEARAVVAALDTLHDAAQATARLMSRACEPEAVTASAELVKRCDDVTARVQRALVTI